MIYCLNRNMALHISPFDLKPLCTLDVGVECFVTIQTLSITKWI